MAQDRMIRASMRESEKVSGWPFELRYFWTQLWGYCDDFGRGRYDARLLKAGVLPLDDDVTSERVGRWMLALEMAGVIQGYEVGGKRYFECVNWDEHQEPPYYKKTNVPDSSGIIPEQSKRFKKVPENSGKLFTNRKGIEREVEGGFKKVLENSGKFLENPPVDNSDPSAFCTKHPNGTTSNCRGCADARRVQQAWLRKRADKPTAIPPRRNEGMCHEHADYPLPCDRCAQEAIAS